MTLILIPTEVEAAAIESGLKRLSATGCVVELCGFGPIVSAARTMQALAQHRPHSVALLGIAGALDASSQIGSAYEFDEAVCYGVGVGSGENFRSAGRIGWSQWSARPSFAAPPLRDSIGSVTDRIRFTQRDQPAARLVLTCCAASDSERDVGLRRREHPTAFAEDMESFSVAVACHLADVPLRIFRGISNLAGERNLEEWKIGAAMQAALDLFLATRVAEPN